MKPSKKNDLDKRKLVLLLLFFLIVVFFIVGSSKINPKKTEEVKKSVEGVSVSTTDPVKEIKEVVQQRIETIQQEAENIDIVEIASSSPQVQKIINDIKSLEKYPSDQAKGLCQQICNGL